MFPIVKIPSAGITVPAGMVIVQSPSVKIKQPILVPGGPISSIYSPVLGSSPLLSEGLYMTSLITTEAELQPAGAVMLIDPFEPPLQLTFVTFVTETEKVKTDAVSVMLDTEVQLDASVTVTV